MKFGLISRNETKNRTDRFLQKIKKSNCDFVQFFEFFLSIFCSSFIVIYAFLVIYAFVQYHSNNCFALITPVRFLM